MRSNKLVLPPIRLVASATAINSVGKNARKRLKAIACEITLHRGNTRTNIPYTRRRSPATDIITGHYTCLSRLVSEAVRPTRILEKLCRESRILAQCKCREWELDVPIHWH